VIPRFAVAAIGLVAILAIACSGPAAVATSPAASSEATVVPIATPVPATSPSGPISAASAPASAEASGGPPEARLGVEGGDPVVGQLGTYIWADGGSDSPWLPGAPLTAAAGESLTMTLAGGVGAGEWTARRVPAGSEGGDGASVLGNGTGGPVTFEAPGTGAWSVQVTVQFAGDLGSASYYWRLDVS
jgi:hypothetical protein